MGANVALGVGVFPDARSRYTVLGCHRFLVRPSECPAAGVGKKFHDIGPPAARSLKFVFRWLGARRG